MLQQQFYPQGFHPFHFLGQKTQHLTDGGGILPYGGVSDFLEGLKPNDGAYLLLHPVHYERNGTDVIYAKRFGEAIDPRKAQEMIAEKTTSYLGMSIADIPHLDEAHRIITERAKERYRKMIRIVDAGCGIGLLGAYLLHYNNLKYTGFDVSPEFIEIGQEFFELQGYCPKLYVADIYEHQPKGDILAFLGYEDCDTDYDRLLEICTKYPEVLITIVSRSMHDAAEERGKHYYYIGEKEFEDKFGKAFNVVEKIVFRGKRTLYHLERKSNED
jgi:SAM-dependent methyltransferase